MTGEISLEMAEALDLKRAIWRKRMEHKSVSEISNETGLEEKDIIRMLEDEYSKRQTELDELVAREKVADLERMDILMGQYFKVATMDHIALQAISNGEPVTELCFDRPAKAALVYLQFLEKKAAILGYRPDNKKGAKPIDQGWYDKRKSEVKALLN